MADNKDRQMLEKCISKEAIAVFKNAECNFYPLDKEIVNKLEELYKKIDKNGDDFYIFRFRQDIVDPLWKELIEKSIKCLRYYDEREPFKDAKEKKQEKAPKAYGIDELKE